MFSDVHDPFPVSIRLLLPNGAVLAVPRRHFPISARRAVFVSPQRVPEIAQTGGVGRKRLPGERHFGRRAFELPADRGAPDGRILRHQHRSWLHPRPRRSRRLRRFRASVPCARTPRPLASGPPCPSRGSRPRPASSATEAGSARTPRKKEKSSTCLPRSPRPEPRRDPLSSFFGHDLARGGKSSRPFRRSRESGPIRARCEAERRKARASSTSRASLLRIEENVGIEDAPRDKRRRHLPVGRDHSEIDVLVPRRALNRFDVVDRGREELLDRTVPAPPATCPRAAVRRASERVARPRNWVPTVRWRIPPPRFRKAFRRLEDDLRICGVSPETKWKSSREPFYASRLLLLGDAAGPPVDCPPSRRIHGVHRNPIHGSTA